MDMIKHRTTKQSKQDSSISGHSNNPSNTEDEEPKKPMSLIKDWKFLTSCFLLALVLILYRNAKSNDGKLHSRYRSGRPSAFMPKKHSTRFILYNGSVVTVNGAEGNWVKDAIAVKDGIIVGVGSRQDLFEQFKHYKKHDLKGHTVIPGLIDAHSHLLMRGRQLNQINLLKLKSIQEIRRKILKEAPPNDGTADWVGGYGWDQNEWADAQFPTSKDLRFKNSHLDNRVIRLVRKDFHALWLNDRGVDLVLEKLPELKDPNYKIDGGEIIRFPDGRPTGVFLDNAMAAVQKLAPAPSLQSEIASWDQVSGEMLGYGMTGAHDAGSSPSEIEFYKGRIRAGDFNIRLYAMALCRWGSNKPCDQLTSQLEDGIGNRLFVRGVKLIGDGALGSWGAAMLKPYDDNPSTSGFLLTESENLRATMKRLIDGGWQVNVHCIGDLCTREVLRHYDSIYSQLNITDNTDLRNRIEHVQFITPTDLERMVRLKILPSMQPTHATSDMGYCASRLGDRCANGYRWKTLLDGVGRIALGSNFPVEHVNPWEGLYAAVTRLDQEGNSPHGKDGWYPSERLSRAEALKGFTLDAAYASFMDHLVGSLSVGKFADLAIVPHNPLDCTLEQLLTTRVKATVVGGKIVYGDLP